MLWLWALIMVQGVIAVGVVIILLKKLNRELTAVALEKLQAMAGDQIPARVVIKSAATVDPHMQGRVQSLLRAKSPQVQVVFNVEPALKGGMVIELAGNRIDCSLSGRLQNFFSTV